MSTIINRIINGETVNCYNVNHTDNYYKITYNTLTGMFIEKEYHNNKLIEILSLCIDDIQDIIENADRFYIY